MIAAVMAAFALFFSWLALLRQRRFTIREAGLSIVVWVGEWLESDAAGVQPRDDVRPVVHGAPGKGSAGGGGNPTPAAWAAHPEAIMRSRWTMASSWDFPVASESCRARRSR
jgi:hypothetical protein